ncbi:hypothetical protein A2572_04820 [Candidatus Collierbacteria bacterium RIFOXYD1_FULL_40_9]|uniref:Activator of Hsp90 ATPase homologue 1/2-like C-terminal domain-containing protein n=1 Tax=Candidatus Collierbacteria bacterium RIFOXYD1_FULL_40_9 TaxID=1817731 RepID=A0A1F5FVH7_9BACT|nr:MAG: hypothetical protein A2572_04820 [Candidatus Collierbacteria bacterium RIFOXYD1_FULL_40_9]
MSTITVEVVVKLPVETVWQSWTTPQDIIHWNHASTDWHCPKAENNLVVGGRFSYTMAAKDGSNSFNFSGTYTQIDNLKEINYELDDKRQVQIIFERQSENSTKIIEIFETESENSEKLQRDGWQAILNNFKNYTENKLKV